MREEKGERSKQTRKLLGYLVTLYEAWGKPEKAEEHRAALAAAEH